MFETAEKRNSNSIMGKVGRSAKRNNRTGIPIQLKERMEQTTGLSFDDVRVHYNSSLPAKLDALAYTKGDQVEIGPGQERHLPHELGHVVQQKLGMVRANAVHSNGIPMNTDPLMEHQADEIGAGKRIEFVQRMRHNVIQRCGNDEQLYDDYDKEGDYVVRGGLCQVQQFINGSAERDKPDVTENTKLSEISVNHRENTSIRTLSMNIPNGQIGVTEKNTIETQGGKLEQKPLPENPFHHEISGLTAKQLNNIFIKGIKNPSKIKS